MAAHEPPRHLGRRRKRVQRSWDTFLQLLLFATVAVVLKHHFGVDLPPLP